jgi:hypothetical protein
MGHIAKNCPGRREEYKKRNNKRHHAHAAEDDEPPKKLTKEEIEDYVLFFRPLRICDTWRGYLAHR